MFVRAPCSMCLGIVCASNVEYCRISSFFFCCSRIEWNGHERRTWITKSAFFPHFFIVHIRTLVGSENGAYMRVRALVSFWFVGIVLMDFGMRTHFFLFLEQMSFKRLFFCIYRRSVTYSLLTLAIWRELEVFGKFYWCV